MRQHGCCGALRGVPRARHATQEYSRGTTSLPGHGARGPSGAHRCCGCGVAPPQRPSPLRVCRYLNNNTLTGSVPSSLSALTNLEELCVPFLPMAFARAAEEGRIGRLCSECARHVGGMHCMSWASSGGGAAARLLRYSQRGPRARHVTTEFSRGTPSYKVRCAGTVGAHGCCGCGVAPPERPSPLRVCSELNQNALTGSVPSSLSTLTNLIVLCVPPSCHGACVCGGGGSG